MAENLRRRTRRAFAWVAVIPFILCLSLFWASHRYGQSVHWVAHTWEVLNASDALLLSVTEAESAGRGFLVTRDREFLDRYDAVKPRVRKQFDALLKLTADNLRQQSNLARLSTAVELRMQLLDRVLSEMQRANTVPADLLRVGADRMASIRQITGEVKQEERRLLAQRRQTQRETAIVIILIFAAGMTVTIVLLLGASKLISRFAAERDSSERQLRQLNAELESRVEERTAALSALAEKLSRSNHDLTQFAYIASHDLQEPLRTVASYAGLLARRYQGKLDEQADRYITFLIGGAKRMQALVQDLLNYSRAGTQTLQFENTNLAEVIEDVRDGLRVAFMERQVQLTVDPMPTVFADNKRLGQVFQNLITNAMKFTKPGHTPQIHIGARQEGDYWLVWVSDNGIGFEPEYAERIFGIFQRLHAVGTYPGTGIGLAICKRIVEAHGGRIWAESVVDVGSKFCFTLPIAMSRIAVA